MKNRSIFILIVSLCILVASSFIGTSSVVYADSEPFPPPPDLRDSTITSVEPPEDGVQTEEELSFIELIEILITITI